MAEETLGREFATALAAKETDAFDRDGRIGWMRALCSGFRPLDEGAGEAGVGLSGDRSRLVHARS
ncbi:MAG TPA: hypothetical protein VFX44_05530 [Solirubrobacterales bacterium]|nr:hypothetical protein [Solirubrobacterales bacterium]